MEEFPVHTNTLTQFLGMKGYFHKFIENYAKIAAPLTEVVRKDQEWNWTPHAKKLSKF